MNTMENSKKFYDIGCQAKDLFLHDVAIKYLSKASELGNADAMYLLGNIYSGNDETSYRYGHLEKEDERIKINDNEQFFKWYRSAADNGCKKAFIEVALHYLDKDNLEFNKRAAKKWFNLAISWNQSDAEKGDPVAMLAIAKAYSHYNFNKTRRYGGNPDKNSLSNKWQKFAFATFKRHADEGDAEAMIELGIMFYYGTGVTENYAESVRLLKRAAESDDDKIKIRAYRKLAEIIKANADSIAFYKNIKSNDDFIAFYKKAAQLGDFISMRILWKYYSDKNLAESERWLKKSEEIQAEFLSFLKQEEL